MAHVEIKSPCRPLVIFSMELTTQSSLGFEGNTIISRFTCVPVANFYLGNFAEDEGEHYICLGVEDEVENCDNDYTSEKGNERMLTCWKWKCTRMRRTKQRDQ